MQTLLSNVCFHSDMVGQPVQVQGAFLRGKGLTRVSSVSVRSLGKHRYSEVIPQPLVRSRLWLADARFLTLCFSDS